MPTVPPDPRSAISLGAAMADLSDAMGYRRPEGGNWAGVACLPVWNGNLGAFTLRVRLGTLDEQLQAAPGPGHVFNIQPDEFGKIGRAHV